MPTIDQLAPATAASDGDELLVSQAGVTRKITRSQVLAGVQDQLALAAGNLLGRSTGGTGAPEKIAVGANLILANGTLSANAVPYVVSSLPMGTVPAAEDLVALSQSGTNTAVTYGQFVSGLASVTNVDGSQLILTPSGSGKSVKLADFAADTLPIGGGTMTGPLTLSGDPTAALHAASKSYVDTQFSNSLPKTGGSLSGPLTLQGDPTAASQAATKNYVDDQLATVLPKTGGALSGALSLAADPSTAMQAATKNYVDNQTSAALPKSGGALTGALMLASDPTAAMQAATKEYVDTKLSRAGDTLTGALTLAADPAAPLQAATKQYVDSQVATSLPKSGGIVTGPLSVSSDPTSSLEVASKHYVDAQLATALPLSGGVLTGPVTLATDPTTSLQPATKQYVDARASSMLPVSGGTLTGPLTLAGNPTADLQAATKEYVDLNQGATGVINVKAPPYNAKIDGQTDDTAAFIAAYQAAPAGSVIYVPNGVCKLNNPSSWGVPLTKWVKWIVDGTTLTDGTPLSVCIPSGNAPASLVLPGVAVGNSGSAAEFSQGASQPTDFSILHTSYIVNHSGGSHGFVSTATRNDTIIYNSPDNYIWGALDRLIWSGQQTPSSATPAQHVGRYVQTIRATIGTDSTGKPLPQPQLWTACLEYRDTTGKPSSSTNASITVEMDWYGNGADDGNSRQLQSLVVGQHNTGGSPVEIGSVIGVYLAAGHAGHACKVFNVGIPFSGAILDTTASQQLPGAAAIRLAAGHAVAFEPTNNYKLWFDSTTNTLRWNQGSLTFIVGKGLSVGFQSVYSSDTALPSYAAGNVVFLIGASNYTITLPSASTVPAGTGYTFSALGSGIVTIASTGADAIDNGPITLHQNDRYHLVSDGSGTWREIFRTNAVSPKFGGPPILPSYTVAGLPASSTAGATAFASNGRKPSESEGAGSGVAVFYDGASWISVCSGTQVLS